jgi:putative DNA methylase
MTDDRRLIEDYLPIEAISAEASREKSVRKGHISALHLWWARKPTVACRAAVYAALSSVSRFVPNGASDDKQKSLGRANAAKFIQRLCRYPNENKLDERADVERCIREAQEHLLEAHAARLTEETGRKVTVHDIVEGRASRPKVLDMFAGGGSIPLEALRLGCEAHALDLNPVAHIVELCTLVYPQKYSKPDFAVRGMAGPKNEKNEGTWGGLAAEIRYWGNHVLQDVQADIGDLYPLIPDFESKGKKGAAQSDWLKEYATGGAPAGYLMPVAYLWTRTVTCKNPNCRAEVPLVKQTWLCKKKDRNVALKIVAPKGHKRVRFEVIESSSEKSLGFDPELGSAGGNATCPFCGTVADSEYVSREGCAGRMDTQLMAIACTRPGRKGKVYLSAESVVNAAPDRPAIRERINKMCQRANLTIPSEPLPTPGTLGFRIQRYGFKTWGELYSDRQLLALLSFVAATKLAERTMSESGYERDRTVAVATFLGALVDRLADFNSSFCIFNYTGGRGVKNTFSRHALPMVWDFAETNPFNPDAASWPSGIDDLPAGLREVGMKPHGQVKRGSATNLPWPDQFFDAIITDPPYYDNVPYADISDFFYVWLKRTVGNLYPDHFASELTPKKSEAVAEPMRYGGSMEKAKKAYEQMMAQAFREGNRVLKRGGELVVVYAHKTTLGWATLVDALRQAGFVVNESWPLDTEKPGRLRAQDSAALASSIFLVARKRDGSAIGKYEAEVQPELEQIVAERVATLWSAGISGADLVIACVGAGLRAFTRFARVEYANGEEMPAARFLAEVETVVLETILGRLSKEVGANNAKYSLVGLDAATRFYLLWRYTYRNAELESGEAIIFANGTHVELDGADGLSSGARALVEKKKSKYAVLNYRDRGDNDRLGLPSEDGQPAPLVDVLHRTLWLMEHKPREIGKFLIEAGPNRDQMRLVVQALTGPALKGGELSDVSPTGELAVLAKLAANWRSVVDDAVASAREREDRRVGQRDIFGRG